MKLRRLLDIQSEETQSLASISLQKNFGDTFLIRNNSIYRRIRELTLKLNFKYSLAQNHFYSALPLSQLEKVLKAGEIPYVDNVSVLFEIEKASPNSTSWDDIVDNFKCNHLFHESCHAVARNTSKHFAPELFASPVSPKNQEFRIAAALIEESFANTCELLGIIDATDAAHRLFYEANSYIFMPEDRQRLNQLLEDLTPQVAFKMILYWYLAANFLRDRLSDQELVTIAKLCSSTELREGNTQQIKHFRALARIAFDLNPRFRTTTTPFYFRMMKIETSVGVLRKIDFLKLLKTPLPKKGITSAANDTNFTNDANDTKMARAPESQTLSALVDQLAKDIVFQYATDNTSLTGVPRRPS